MSRPIRSLRSLLFLSLFTGLFLYTFLITAPGHARPNPKYASIVMDADTGMILSESYADKALHPASLTKMMTLLLTFEAIERGELRLRDRIVISSHAASMVPSKLDIKPGQSIRVEDAIYILVTKSANDVAVALAEAIAGTESHFAKRMTARAHAIGMSRTRFRNASGLHNSTQVSTARDMAVLARFIIQKYPKYYHYFSTRNFTYQGVTYRNHNHLLGVYKGMDGFKTGYVQASGFNLVASAKRNNRRIIGVVFGGRTAKTRNAHMAKILDRGFAKVDRIVMAAAHVPVPGRKPDRGVQVVAAADVLNAIAPAAGGMATDPKWADLNPMLQNQAFSTMIGQGDFDPAQARRLETGLIALAAHRGVTGHKKGVPSLHTVSYVAPAVETARTGSWSIQVGAFASRLKTDQAIREARLALPDDLNSRPVMIVPLKTAKGWMFRGRLSGYSRKQAVEACRYLDDCLPVSPRAH